MTMGERERLIEEILDEVFGLGPLEPLLKDPSISDIMVNGFDNVYVERAGRLVETNVRFKDHAHVRMIIDRIVNAIGRRIDDSSPIVDARLPERSSFFDVHILLVSTPKSLRLLVCADTQRHPLPRRAQSSVYRPTRSLPVPER